MEKPELRQELIDRINRIKIPKDIQDYESKVIPLGKSVILQRVKGGERKTKSGLLLADSVSTEVMARIIAFGPECHSYLRRGLLVTYNQFVNMESIVNGESMLMCHQDSIYHIVVDEEVDVRIAPETPEQKRVREKITKQTDVLKRVYEKELNDEDKYEEKLKAKKKTQFAKTNIKTKKK